MLKQVVFVLVVLLLDNHHDWGAIWSVFTKVSKDVIHNAVKALILYPVLGNMIMLLMPTFRFGL